MYLKKEGREHGSVFEIDLEDRLLNKEKVQELLPIE